jgi:chitin synthase
MYQPSNNPEQDQYPLQDTQFSNQPPVNRSPFEDPYPDEHGTPAHQPLLNSQTTVYPPSGNFQNTPPYPPYHNNNSSSPVVPQDNYVGFNPPSPNMHYGEAPRRQVRRYKTSKVSFFIVIIKRYHKGCHHMVFFTHSFFLSYYSKKSEAY